MSNPPALMTTSQVAHILAVDPATVRRWIDEDKLPGIRLPGGHLRVRRTDVDRLLAAPEPQSA